MLRVIPPRCLAVAAAAGRRLSTESAAAAAAAWRRCPHRTCCGCGGCCSCGCGGRMRGMELARRLRRREVVRPFPCRHRPLGITTAGPHLHCAAGSLSCQDLRPTGLPTALQQPPPPTRWAAVQFSSARAHPRRRRRKVRCLNQQEPTPLAEPVCPPGFRVYSEIMGPADRVGVRAPLRGRGQRGSPKISSKAQKAAAETAAANTVAATVVATKGAVWRWPAC